MNLSKLIKSAVAIAAVAISSAGFGYNWVEWDGSGDWPTSGDVKIINKNTTIVVDDAHVAAVVGWENLSFEYASDVLLFSNETVQATYNAADTSGDGIIRVCAQSCGLTINSTNPGKKFTGDGRYEFNDAKVTVTTDTGLCPGGKARIVYSASTKGDLVFRKPAWDAADFTGVKAITNSCKLYFNPAVQSGVANAKIGSMALDEYFVQNASVYSVANAANKYLKLRNNYEQISGDFGMCSESYTENTYQGQSPYYTTDLGGTIRFGGTVAWQNNGPNAVLGCLPLGSTADWYLGFTGGFHATSFQPNYGNFHILVDDVFKDVATSTIPAPGKVVELRPYIHDQSNYANTNAWHLNGHELVLGGIRPVSPEVTSTTTGYTVFESSTPAKLTLKEGYYTYYGGHYNLTRNATFTSAPYFDGPIEILAANAATNIFATKVSTREASLVVSNDTTVIFKWKGGWQGKITVESGSTLVLGEMSATYQKIGDTVYGYPEIIVEEGGHLELSGYTYLARLSLAGKEIAPCSGVKFSSLIEQYDISEDILKVADPNQLLYLSWGARDTNWPAVGEEGAPVYLKSNAKTYIGTDEEMAALARAGTIYFSWQSQLYITNETGTAYLNADLISGDYGSVVIKDSAGVVIKGDNSGFKGETPHFEIINSEVAVSNRFGLGGAETAAAQLTYGESLRQVRFGLADSKYFTNEVDIIVKGSGATVATTPVVFGSEAIDEYFIQKGGFYDIWNGKYSQRIRLKNNIEFLGKFGSKCANSIYIEGVNEHHLKFGPTATFAGNTAPLTLAMYNSRNSNGGDVIFDCDTKPNLTTLFYNVANVKMARDYQFGGVEDCTTAWYYFNTSSYDSNSILDLQGHPVVFKDIGSQYSDDKDHGYGLVTSQAPATFTLMSVKDRPSESLVFEGQASFRYLGTGTNLIQRYKSTSTGTYQVSSGTAGFIRGAIWRGNVTIDGTGTLLVSADSAAAFGSNTGDTKSTTVLNVNGDTAKMELAGEGTTYVMNCFTNGVQLKRGEYTSANCSFVTGLGTLKVMKGAQKPVVLFL